MNLDETYAFHMKDLAPLLPLLLRHTCAWTLFPMYIFYFDLFIFHFLVLPCFSKKRPGEFQTAFFMIISR